MRAMIQWSMFVCLFAVLFTNCKKEETQPSDAEMQSSIDNATAETIFNNAYDLLDENTQQQDELNGFQSEQKAEDRSACVAIAIEPNAPWPNIFPAKLILDFGAGCTTQQGHEVAGKVTATFSGPWRETGTTVSVSFSEFVLNGWDVEGVKEVINNGKDANGIFSYTVNIKNGQLTNANGKTIKYDAVTTRRWVEGAETNFWTDGLAGIFDDVWEVEHDANGVNRLGTAYEVTTTTMLRRELDCRWLTMGVLELKQDGQPDVTLDYGAGTCDNKATLSIGSYTQEITLP